MIFIHIDTKIISHQTLEVYSQSDGNFSIKPLQNKTFQVAMHHIIIYKYTDCIETVIMIR